MPRCIVLLFVGALLAGSVAPAAAQLAPVRFTVVSTADSTFTFAVGTESWVAVGRTGLVVDPARQDALVAQFRVLRITSGSAVAVITGQTTRVTVRHIALLEIPKARWFRSPLLWKGTVAGLLLGFLLGRAL